MAKSPNDKGHQPPEKDQVDAFKENARDEALSAAEKGLQAAREALEAAERKLAEVQKQVDAEAQARAASASAPVDAEAVVVESAVASQAAKDALPKQPTTPQPAVSAQETTASDAVSAQPQQGFNYQAQQPYAPQAQQPYAPGQPYSAQGQQAYGQYAPPAGRAYQQPPVQPHYDAPYVSSKDHVAAGLLAIFLGGFGIHKFYLGCSTQGFIMLAISILGGIFSFGLATGVIWLIAIIEGIIYLTKNQTEFERTYVYGKREWF